MKFLFTNHIENALQSLKNSRMRSMLTALGIAIGVASITTILALSSGLNKTINSQISSIGGNIIIVRPGSSEQSNLNISKVQPYNDYATSTLTESDVTYIKNSHHIKETAPIMILNGSIKGESTAPSNSPIVATTSQFASISDLALRDGQFLGDDIDQNSVVIGSQLSTNIFGTESSIGRILTIRGQSFTVVGVLKDIKNPVNYNSVDLDNAAIINFASGKKLNQGAIQIQQINIKTDSVDNIKKAGSSIESTLKISHNNENDFSVIIGNDISQPTNQLLTAVTFVTTAIATISIVVGGIGVMNIMLVTVAERTREIGIRKSLGANNADISWQFLIESLAISVSGGISGYIGGCAIAFIASNFLIFDPVFDWQTAVIALGVSIVTGIIFGLYPAIRASRKDPIESLNR